MSATNSGLVSAHGTPPRVPGATPSGTGLIGTTRAGDMASSLCSCGLETLSGPAGPVMVLHVAGEIDLSTLPLLEQALTAAVVQRPGDLVVDLAAVGFCCVRGFAVLAAAADTAQRNGTGYVLSGLLPHLDRCATLLWPEQTTVRYHSVAAAVMSIRIEQTYRPT